MGTEFFYIAVDAFLVKLLAYQVSMVCVANWVSTSCILYYIVEHSIVYLSLIIDFIYTIITGRDT